MKLWCYFLTVIQNEAKIILFSITLATLSHDCKLSLDLLLYTLGLKACKAVIHLENGCIVSPGSNIARQLPDLCACVPYPWGKITCRHNIISTLRFSSIVSKLKIYHHCLCYMFNHVDTSWPFGVLEYQHVNRVQYFEYFCPGTPCSIC